MPIEYIALLIWFSCMVLCAVMGVVSYCYPPTLAPVKVKATVGVKEAYAQWCKEQCEPIPAPVVAQKLLAPVPVVSHWHCGQCNKEFDSVRPERIIKHDVEREVLKRYRLPSSNNSLWEYHNHYMRFVTCNDCADKMLKEMERPHKVAVPHYNGGGWHNMDIWKTFVGTTSKEITTMPPLCGKAWLEEHPNGHHYDTEMTILYDGEEIGTFDQYSKRGDVKATMSAHTTRKVRIKSVYKEV